MSKVLIIYTGGTIGMIQDHSTGALVPFDHEHLMNFVPEVGRINAEISVQTLGSPIDSSNMDPSVWKDIVMMIKNNYETHDGFVVLHGSDTMAYTASALSYALAGIKKPVILTGSQLPIGTIRTDGKENLLTSIEIAATKQFNGQPRVQDVAVYFEYKLLRGNRVSKVSAEAFEAFESFNFPALAEAGVNVRYNDLGTPSEAVLGWNAEYDANVVFVSLFPGINAEIFNIIEPSRVKGVVLKSYGAGNAPTNERFLKGLKNLVDSGTLVLNITQCEHGTVDMEKYETGKGLADIGILSGGDMTQEAAITKMMWVLANVPKEFQKEALVNNLAGEVTL